MLEAVSFLRTLARIVVLIVIASGATTYSSIPAERAAGSFERPATRGPATVEAIRPDRSQQAILARNSSRLDAAARANDPIPGLPAATSGLTTPGISGAILRQEHLPRRTAPTAFLLLRGPPLSI